MPPLATSFGPERSGLGRFAQAVRDDLRAPSPADEPCPGTVLIDHQLCIGCGTCVENTDLVFALDPGTRLAQVKTSAGPRERIEDAIDACPVACIRWSEPG